MADNVDTPHFKVPFRIDGETASYVEQGSTEEIIQNCIAILRTPYGSREDDSDFGLIQQEFEDVETIARHEIEAALVRDEPRAQFLTEEQMEGLIMEVRVQLQTTTALEASDG